MLSPWDPWDGPQALVGHPRDPVNSGGILRAPDVTTLIFLPSSLIKRNFKHPVSVLLHFNKVPSIKL